MISIGLAQIKLFAAPRKVVKIVHERLEHRINHADGIAYIKSLGGHPVTREELRDHMKGSPLYPNEIQWTPIWIDADGVADWMQIGEGEGDAGTAWLERSPNGYLSRHTNADNNQYGSHDWNVTVVYWKTTWGVGLDPPLQ